MLFPGRDRSITVALSLLVVLVGCQDRAPSVGAAPARLADLLAIGAAHAEIDDWQPARESFRAAERIAPDEPAVLIDLALAELSLGELDAAALKLERLERLGGELAPSLGARVEQLRGALAVERGDFDQQEAALRRAALLDPEEPAFAFALAQVASRGQDEAAERGRWLERAHELWPDNSRVTAELAQWSLDQPTIETQQRGAELALRLAADSGEPRVLALVERGREQLGETSDAPVALLQALNLLRPGKRFQVDSASLEARLELRALAEPSAGVTVPADLPSSITLAVGPPLPLELADGEIVVDVIAFSDATAETSTAERAAHLAVLSDRALYWLRREDREARLIASVAGGRRLQVAELDGDGLMELVLETTAGARIYGRTDGNAWAPMPMDALLSAAGALRSSLLIDFEHDGDLDLLAVDGQGELILVTHRGESGWGAPAPVALPTSSAPSAPPQLLASSDLDGDGDQDLLVLTATEIDILLNWRQGEYVSLARRPLPAPPRSVVTLDSDGNGTFDLVVAGEGGINVWRNPGDGLLTRDDGAIGPADRELAAGARALTAADLDLDGDLDLVATIAPAAEPGAPTVRVLQNVGGRFSVASTAQPAPIAPGEGVLAMDLDGDHRPDLLAWGDDEVATFAVSGDGEPRWIELGLRGLPGKVPLDARGSVIEVVGEGIARRYQTNQPEITLGLGARRPALVRVTWPNGISEYLFEPAPKRRHVIEQVLRIEGSCPFLYASDGLRMRFVTDILGGSPLGMQQAPGVYVVPDPEEYLRLPDWVAWEQGVVELRITEELREVAYLDQLELVAVDAPAAIAVYNGERWIEPPVAGLDLHLLSSLRPPEAVHDDSGDDVLDLVRKSDRVFLTNHRRQRLYQGAVERHRLTLELPPEIAAAPRPALLLEGWLHWANTSVNVARAQDPEGAPLFPMLEVGDGAGLWRVVPAAVGLPAGKHKSMVVDLGGLVDGEHRHLRLTTDFEVYWDRIAVGTSEPHDATPHRVHRLAPRGVELAYGGFSRWYREAANGPYVFDYHDRRPHPWRPVGDGGERALSWREHAGWYTHYGDVTQLVSEIDEQMVVFGSGEELALEFDSGSLPPLPDGWRRTLFLHSEGWEKDGDPNVACSDTVEPMPWRAMTDYPCAGTPGVAGAARERATSRNRWVSTDRLSRRIELMSRTSQH